MAFENCGFLMGAGDTIVIVVPKTLPHAETYTVSISDADIKFKADREKIAHLDYQDREVYRRIIQNTQVGIVEYDGTGTFPDHITGIAYVEVRKAAHNQAATGY